MEPSDMVKRKTIFAFVVMAAFAVAMFSCACLLFCVRWMQPETKQKHLEWKGRCSVDVFGKYGYTASDRMHVMPITEARRSELKSIYARVAAAYSNCQHEIIAEWEGKLPSMIASFFLERAAVEQEDALFIDRCAHTLNPTYRHSQQRRDNLAALRPPNLTGKPAELYDAAQADAAQED